MPKFRYSALHQDGQSVTGFLDADSTQQAIADLTDRGAFVTDISSGDDGSGRLGIPNWIRRNRIPARLHASMLEQLATALQSGLPLLVALRAAEKQADNRALRAMLGDLATRVQSGESLSAAMASQEGNFSKLQISMIRVGETAGLLDSVMVYLADLAVREMEIREKIRSAAAYPLFVLGLAFVSVLIILTWILPQILETVTESGALLPLPTQILLGVTSVLRTWWWLLLIGIVLLSWGFGYWLSKPEGRLAFDTFKLKVPVLGTALRRIAVTRFARTLGTLSKAGVQILEALNVLRDTLGNEALARKIDEVAASITQGESIAEPLARTGEFPPLLTQVIAMGERTGRLDELLLRTAKAYERETTASVERLMTLLPAVLIVLLAVVVGLVLASVILPIANMQMAI